MPENKTDRALLAAYNWVGAYEALDSFPEADGIYSLLTLEAAWSKITFPTAASVSKQYPDFPTDMVESYEYLTNRLRARGWAV